MRSWVGDRLRAFDRAATDQWVRRVVGEVPESVRLLLDLVADGVKLTPGGRLPRTVVRSMQQHRQHWYPLGRPASIEDDLPPLGALHELLRGVGLLRLRHGVLTPTRAAGEDLAIVRRLRSAGDSPPRSSPSTSPSCTPPSASRLRRRNTFDTSFPDAIPNDSNDFDERVHDYVALCRHIDERDLPEAYERMMRLVTEQTPDAILTPHRVAEQEARRISEQIDRVGTGLGAVEFNRGTRLTLRATPRQLTAVAELTEIVRSISRRIAEVGLGDKQAILDQYADILRLRNQLASTAPDDKAWTRDALDVRNRFTFDCAEWDVSTEELIRTHSNAGDNSGGEQEKLMAFRLAGALSFNLASCESANNTPVFAQLMLDEAFSKSDPQFAQQALSTFRKFGFQLVIVATMQNATTIQPYVDSVVMVSKTEPTGRNARLVASVETRTISEFTSLRHEMRATAERVPAGV